MMPAVERSPRKQPTGKSRPRIAPPTPARSLVKELTETGHCCGIDLMPWQQTAGRYIYAVAPRGWLYPEVAVIVARQQGKTTLLVPHIVKRLKMGRRILHAAQNRDLPRSEVFPLVAEAFESNWPEEIIRIRVANGQEEIRVKGGGHYRIVAATRRGARGHPEDDLIIDELREFADEDFLSAAKPTLTASATPQTLYLSNAGDERSAVLNALRKRATDDPSLAYLEWSAAPERAPDDLVGWLEANPAIGHLPSVLDNLEREHRANLLGGTMHVFETEHLCRWVPARAQSIVDPHLWADAEGVASQPRRPVMGIGLHPSGDRASAAIAWQEADGGFAIEVVADVTGDPIDLDTFGPELRRRSVALGVSRVVYDPYDEHLARHFRKPVAINGRDFANACGTFVRLLEGGQLHWRTHPDLGDAIGRDLAHTTKRTVGPGAWMAVRTNDETPITAVLAAIRALGSVYRPPSPAVTRIY